MGSDLLLWCQALAHEAREELEDAADLLEVAWISLFAAYERLGAAWDAARAEALLRGLGVRRNRRRPRSRSKTGWESLTPAEREVVTLAAQGLTNSETAHRAGRGCGPPSTNIRWKDAGAS